MDYLDFVLDFVPTVFQKEKHTAAAKREAEERKKMLLLAEKKAKGRPFLCVCVSLSLG